jgi:hypothetical protein
MTIFYVLKVPFVPHVLYGPCKNENRILMCCEYVSTLTKKFKKINEEKKLYENEKL